LQRWTGIVNETEIAEIEETTGTPTHTVLVLLARAHALHAETVIEPAHLLPVAVHLLAVPHLFVAV
jgi:hypothetical protein